MSSLAQFDEIMLFGEQSPVIGQQNSTASTYVILNVEKYKRFAKLIIIIKNKI
jgi:hypothetical protein